MRLSVSSRRYHFHGPGVIYIITTVVLVLGAINGQNNLLFWIFGLAVGGLLVSGVLSGAALMGIELTREPAAVGSVDQPMTVRYRVRNRNRLFSAFALYIEELPTPGPSDDFKPWWDRMPAPVAFAAAAPAHSETVVAATVRPTARGQADFWAVRVWTTFPFGLTRKSVTFTGAQRSLIRPAMLMPDPAALHRALGGGDSGPGRRDPSGAGEFHSLREFVPGDSRRLIAWRPSARLGTTLVRETEERPADRLWLVLDVTNPGPELERLISYGAGVAGAMLKDGREVGVLAGSHLVVSFARPGKKHLETILNGLAALDPEMVRSARQSPPVRRRDGLLVLHAGDAPSIPVPESGATLRLPAAPVDASGDGDPRSVSMAVRLKRLILPNRAAPAARAEGATP